MILAVLLAAVAVLPSDRLAMADRLFNRGKYAEAETEYRALSGEKGIAPDRLAFRLAECDRVAGRSEQARQGYLTVFTKYPDSEHAVRARFMYAMGLQGEERRRLLSSLDTDRVDLETRTAALYYLGSELSDAELLKKCVSLKPKGEYATYANLKYGTMLYSSKDPAERRKGVEVLLGIAFGGSPLAEDALYLAAIQCYRDKRYGEAGSLFRRYRRMFPKGANAADVRSMAVWCDFLEGRYADAAAACGEGETDDLAYIRAACAYSTGDNEKAMALFKKYLEDYPEGRYRSDAELPIARMEFDAAQKNEDAARSIESAKRGFGLSKLATDQLRLAWSYEKANKPEDAKNEYALIAKNFPGSEEAAEALYRRAMIDLRQENWSAAELSLAEAMASGKIGKRLAETLYWRGVAAMRLKHEQEGADFLSEAVKAGLGLDEQREAKLMLADFDYKSGRTEKAKAAYAELVRAGGCERMSAARIRAVGLMLNVDEAEICAKALTNSNVAEWRQSGWALLGNCEERREAYTRAVDAYRKCLAEKATTEDVAVAALKLGLLESKLGEFDAADATLKKAIAFNSANAHARAEAYLQLAKNAGARGDWKAACAYATVITSLFEGDSVCAAARQILVEHPEARESE